MVSRGIEDCPGEPFCWAWEPRHLEGPAPEVAGKQECVLLTNCRGLEEDVVCRAQCFRDGGARIWLETEKSEWR